MKKAAFSRGGLPKIFMDRFGQHVRGFISGLDRLRFRATLRPLFQPGGLEIYLYSGKVLLKDFGKLAKELTDQIRTAASPPFRAAEAADPIRGRLEPEQRGFGPRISPQGSHRHWPNLFVGLRRAGVARKARTGNSYT